YTQVFVDHPTFDFESFVLLFDDDHHLVERQLFAKIMPDVAPRLYEKHTFKDYESYEDASGEHIHFPRLAHYSYYMGNGEEGLPVEYMSESIRVLSIGFNVPIADSKFGLEIAKDGKVWDGV